jgi:ribonuclease HII
MMTAVLSEEQLASLTARPHYGIDEVGRGCLNGNVVVASCYFAGDYPAELDDSKKLTAKKREALFTQIIDMATDYCIVSISPEDVDRLNIRGATLLGMQRSYEESRQLVQTVLVDGNALPDWAGEVDAHAIIKGDGRVAAISAASILAKVTRDQQMAELALRYPMMDYEKHKGYGTARHLELMRKHGLNDSYRRSFRPVNALLDRSPRQGDLAL